MRLSSFTAFWAFLVSTAPHGFEAKAKDLLRLRKLIASSKCTIMAIEPLAVEGEPHQEMEFECELAPEDAGGMSGITAPLKLSPQQQVELQGMIYDGRIDPGEDMLDIGGDEITKNQEIKIDPVASISDKVQKMPKEARARRERHLVDTTGDLNMLLVKVTDSEGKVYPDSPTLMRLV